MRPTHAAYAAFLLVLLTVGGAMAQTLATGEHVACDSATAITSTPDHTIAVDGSSVDTITGEAATAIASVCVTATDSTVTATGPTTTPSTTTAPTTTTTTTPPALDVTGRWYVSSSAFNTPIPANPTLSPDNTAQINWLKANTGGVFGPTTTAHSIWYATDATPKVTVRVNYPTCGARLEQVPIPAGAKPGNGGASSDPESSMIIVNGDSGEEIDMFKLTAPNVTPLSSGPSCAATSTWSATVVARNTPGWTGTGVGYTTRGSGILAGAGMIRMRDTQSTSAGGNYGHALALSYPRNRNTFVAPATHSDGAFTDAQSIPMGSRIQLNPSFNVETSGLPEWQKQICRTMQVYGAIVVDSGAALLSEGLASVRAAGYVWPWEPSWANLPFSVLQNFRVLA